MKPWNLNYWNTGEWQVCNERLSDLRHSGVVINPDRKRMFKSLETTSPDKVKVAIFGQDPYPDHDIATGFAFDVLGSRPFPITLSMIFKEYENDLGLTPPNQGKLEPWVREGVLLWNVISSCSQGHSLSHDWEEWYSLNAEIINKLNEQGIVFVLLGSKARAYKSLINEKNNIIIETSHPSPRGNMNSKTPFIGSRIFTRANEALVSLGKEPVNWKL